MLEIVFDTILPATFLFASIYIAGYILLKKQLPIVFKVLLVFFIIFCAVAVGIIFFLPEPIHGMMIGIIALISALCFLSYSVADSSLQNGEEEETVLSKDIKSMHNKILLFSIFNNIRDLVVVVNNQQMIIFMNQVAVDSFGDNVGMPCSETLLCPPEDCLECMIRTSSSEYQPPQSRELRTKNKLYDLSLNRIYNDPDGNVIIIARDITKRKMVERQLLINEKMVSLGQLVAGVAHEINNPITFVSTNIEYLKLVNENLKQYKNKIDNLLNFARSNTTPEYQAQIKKLSDWCEEKNIEDHFEQLPELTEDLGEGVTRVKKIVKDLKDFSHQGTTIAEETDLNKIIELTLRVAHNEIKNKVTVDKQLQENLPKLSAFPQQLKQAFLNLIVNAAQATKGGDSSELLIKSSFENDEYTIVIQDNGKGIPDRLLERIFDPFFTTKEVGEGTGLGLAVVYGIIEMHNGKIDVKSKEGSGTTFTITIPKNKIVNENEPKEKVSIYSL